MDKCKTQTTTFLLLLFASIVFVLMSSNSTSPLYEHVEIWDSGVYQTIAYSWLDGKIPYKDLFDHKAPLVYLIDAVGYLITGNRFGICIIQILNLFVSVIICWKLTRLRSDKLTSTSIIILFLAIFNCTYNEGNNVEEYCLPFLFASYYYAYIWLKKYDETGEAVIKSRIPFIFGITFGVCAMTRITNALGICIVALCVTYILIKQKKWHELWKCNFLFIAGASMIIIPFCVYFYAAGAWNDFIYCNIIYNINYALMPVENNFFKNTSSVIAYSPGFILLLICLVAIIANKKNNLHFNIVFLLVSFVTDVFFLRGNGYRHYAMTIIPFIPIAANLISDNFNNKKYIKIIIILVTILVSALVLKLLFHNSHIELNKLLFSKKVIENNTSTDFKFYNKLIKEIPSKDKNKIVFVNCEMGFYCINKAIPACRFFVLQDFQAQFSNEYRLMRNKAFENCNAKYIIYNKIPEIATPRIDQKELQKIIERRYNCIKRESGYRLYRIKTYDKNSIQ